MIQVFDFKKFLKLSPETIEMFRRTQNEAALNIPPELALYITQLDEATRLLKQYHTMSECARQLQLLYPELSVSTCKNRLYDSINYMNDQCTVTEGAWLLFYADMMMSLYEICLNNCRSQPVDTDDDTPDKPLDNVPAVREARLCLEKALEYRLRASSNAIDPDRIRFRHQIVSADRPESVLGISAAHSFWDELLKIKKEFMLERAMPILRSDRSRFGLSPYFMGWSGFTSTPNFETDEDWFLDVEKDMNPALVACIQEIAREYDHRLAELEIARTSLDFDRIKSLERFAERWRERLDALRKGRTYYIRASSFSNLKILGIDYIQNQIRSIKDRDMLYTSILAIRKLRVKDMFFGKFGKQHLFDDGVNYLYIDDLPADEKIDDHHRHLNYYKPKDVLYAGYDAGPFQSIVFAHRNRQAKEFRIIKNMWVFHPDQQDMLAKRIDDFFQGGRKEIILHYDRAANQRAPEWKKYYPSYRVMGINDTDVILLKQELEALGWRVILMSKDMKTIYFEQHYRLLNILFGKRDRILIDRTACEALVSSISHSPLKRDEGRIYLDKSSECLPFNDQAYRSTQLASALMYLLWGEYNRLLPSSDLSREIPQDAGTYMV